MASAARLPWGALARVHGSFLLRRARRLALERQWQSRPAGVARSGEDQVGRRKPLSGPAQSGGGGAGGNLGAFPGSEEVGVHHHFFELGGHSLLALQVIWGVREALQVDLPIRSLFET